MNVSKTVRYGDSLTDPDMERDGVRMKTWSEGDVLLDEYTIEKVLGKGGMGKVFRVRRNLDGSRFAVKTIKDSALTNPVVQRQLLRELGLWTSLPEHPHITACRFFRTIEGRFAIFAEYVDGGSLSLWIRQRRLTSIDRILDIAIQIAWGLAAAHSRDIVHQDIKPANILMTPCGIAKITDFGLSRATSGIRWSQSSESSSDSVSVTYRGMTAAYCSPEQALFKAIDYTTDIWSYGVSILEMLTGEARWISGVLAESILESVFLNKGKAYPLSLPETLYWILKKCFRENRDERWADMNELSDKMIEIYSELTGQPYHRIQPVIPDFKAFQDEYLDRIKQDRTHWDEPQQWADRFNQMNMTSLPIVLSKNKSAQVPSISRAAFDLEAYEAILNQLPGIPDCHGVDRMLPVFKFLKHKSHIHRILNDNFGAIDILKAILPRLEQFAKETAVKEIAELLFNFRGFCASLYCSEGLYKEAIAIYDLIVRDSTHNNLPGSKFWAESNISACLMRMGDITEAGELLDTTIQYLEQMHSFQRNERTAVDLMNAYANRAFSHLRTGQPELAVDRYEKALQIVAMHTTSDESTGAGITSEDIAWLHTNLANAFMYLKRYDESEKLYESAISIREKNVFERGMIAHAGELAKTYTCKAWLLNQRKEIDASVIYNRKAVDLLERMVQKEGRTDLVFSLTGCYFNLCVCLMDGEHLTDAEQICLKSIHLLDHLIRDMHRTEFVGDLAMSRFQLAKIMSFQNRRDEAFNLAVSLVPVMEEEARRTNRQDFKNALQEIKEYLNNNSDCHREM